MALKSGRIARKATKKHGKGNRWLKGQSSSTNPKSNKHRAAAKGFFSTTTDIESALTADALSKHNELQNDEEDLCLQSGALSICDDGVSVARSLASNFTNCSNSAFEKFLNKWQPNAEFDATRLAVIAAITEVIKKNSGKETDTEYFASLLTTLECLDIEFLAAVVSVLAMVIKRVPSSVLKAKLSESSKVLEKLLEAHHDSENTILLRGLIGCLMVILRVQDASTWSYYSTKNTYLKILNLVIDLRPRVRKAAQHAICSILKGSSFMLDDKRPKCHPAASETAKFCRNILKPRDIDISVLENGKASSTVLHTMGLLKNVLCTFSYVDVRQISRNILQWMTVNNSIVKRTSLDALHGLFNSQPSPDNLTPNLNVELINELYTCEPTATDAQFQLKWICVLKEAHVNLLKLDDRLCLGSMTTFFKKLCQLWSSPRKEVYACITATLKSLLYSLNGSLVSQIDYQSKLKVDLVESVQKMFNSVDNCLSFQYHEIWPCVFQVLAVFFEVFGKSYHSLMKNCLRSLADLRNSPNFQYTNELDYAFSQAVKSLGPKVILETIPLNLIQDGTNFEHSWLIPFLRDNIEKTELSFFKEYFWPLIEKCHIKIQKSKLEGNVVMVKTYEMLYYQLWSLLPGFCTLPTDLTEAFKAIARDLGRALNDSHGEYKLQILTAIRILINKNLDDNLNIAELSKYAKNYLPIFFNLYGSEPTNDEQNYEGFRLAVFDTIKVYLSIADSDICQSLFVNGLKLFESKESTFTRNVVLDIMRALLPYLKKDLIMKLYDICVPLLGDNDRTTQKKAYRVFEELCLGKSEICLDFVRTHLEVLKSTLLTSLSNVVPSAQAPRLRCLNHIVLQLPKEDREFTQSIIPEVIYCLKENAKKVKLAASNLIITIGERFVQFSEKSEKDSIEDYIGLLLAGEAVSTHFICSTVIAVCHVTCHFKEHLSSDMVKYLLENISVFACAKSNIEKSTSREIGSAVLYFIKELTSHFSDKMVISNVKSIVDILENLSKDCQQHFRLEIRGIFQRLVRKLGYEMVKIVVPESYQKLLTYVHKQELRTKKKKNMERDEEDDDASTVFQPKPQTIDDLLKDSSSEDEMDTKTLKSNKSRKSVWLQEEAETEIVDLLDPRTTKNIFDTKPDKDLKTRKAKDDFKIGPDGRMIIVDEDQEENKSNKVSIIEQLSDNKKRKRIEDDSDDEFIATKSVASTFKSSKSKQRKNVNYGEEYKATKAGGDMKRKGQPDPYAYVPLEFQSLNKRKKAKMAGKFNNIVRSARQGASRGKQTRSKNWKK